MVNKTFQKTIWKTFQTNFSRAIIMAFIVLLGVSFVSGLGTLSTTLTTSINEEYEEKKGLDFILKSKSSTGFTENEINQWKNNPQLLDVMPLFTMDQKDTRILMLDWSQISFHQIEIVEGKKITKKNEILVDQITLDEIGTQINLFGHDYIIVGKVKNPTYYFDKEKELSINQEELNHIYYLDKNITDLPFAQIITDLYMKANLEKTRKIFKKDYKDEIKNLKEEFTQIDPEVAVLTLEENMSYKVTENYGEKIQVIASIFPLFFVLVACLVIYSTINRLIQEERNIMACYRSLGIPKSWIILKYYFFSFFPCFVGAILGFFLGIHFLPKILYPAFTSVFYMPEMTKTKEILPGMITSCLILILISIISISLSWKVLKEKPSELLKAKSPKQGKKILLEKIPWLWKLFSFKYKSAIRNIFRYKANLFMTLISVAGTTSLTFAGFGLYSVVTSPETTEIPISMADTFAIISSVIILFAATLCILVIFNITNMNIEERKKEIASLRVLGYHQKEVSMYIYREINITSILGILLGIPLGYFLLNFLFRYLEFGNIKNVLWFYYLITILLVMIFVFLSEIFLIRKIHNIDMNSSLKNNE